MFDDKEKKNNSRTAGAAEAAPASGPDLENPLILIHVSQEIMMTARAAPIHPVMVMEAGSNIPQLRTIPPIMMKFGSRKIPRKMSTLGQDGTLVTYDGMIDCGWLNLDKWFVDNRLKLGLQDSDYADIRAGLLTPHTLDPFSGYGTDYTSAELRDIESKGFSAELAARLDHLAWGVRGAVRNVGGAIVAGEAARA